VLRRVLAVGAFGLVSVTSCGAPATDLPWAAEAVVYFEAMEDTGARSITEQVRRFYDADALVDTWRTSGWACEGAPACEEWLIARFGATTDESTAGMLFLDTGGAVRMVNRSWTSGVVSELVVQDIGPEGRVTRELQPRSVDDVRAVLGPAVTASLEELAAAHREVWSPADPAAVAARYAPDAELVDGLVGLHLTGRDAIARHALAKRFAAPSVTPPAALLDVDGREAMYVYLPDALPAGPSAPYQLFVIHTPGEPARCPGTTVVALSVRDGLIEHERWYHEIGAARRCADDLTVPEGWWTGLVVPSLPSEVTGTVVVAGVQVTVHDGTPALERYVRWGLERFVAGGLTVPDVALVSFDEDLHPDECPNERDGCCIDDERGSAIYICATEDDICTDAGCRAVSVRWRHLLLHEFGHAWMSDHVDLDAQEQFLALRGLTAWDDPATSWDRRGVEHGAEILAWGLMDEPVVPYRLGASSCDELEAGFRLLTGTAPPRGCPTG
jgi:hypothetical protein